MFKIDELYNTYKHDLYYYLLSLTHDSILSEDLLSETFVCAIRSLGTYKGTSTIKTWLFGIARNVWLQHLRKAKRFPLTNDNEVFEASITYAYLTNQLEHSLLQKEIVERISLLLKQKDSKTQTIVSMRIHGYSYYEISCRLEVSESSARVIDFRTKNWIKTILEKEGLTL